MLADISEIRSRPFCTFIFDAASQPNDHFAARSRPADEYAHDALHSVCGAPLPKRRDDESVSVWSPIWDDA